ncbi:MAG: lactate utilization protein [Treponema sp.]|mgnify:FL=1|nr:lactate utilization protein [Treponema sp.]
MTPKEMRNEKLALRLIKNLEARHFEAYYCPTQNDAKEKILSLIPSDHTVGWGGSMTLDALGIKDALRKKGQILFDRDTCKPEERPVIFKKALTAGTFLTGTNAITEDGELVNVDAVGNRVAALIYGPDSVIVVTSLTKVCKTLEEATSRARNYAAPVNSMRFPDYKTPCKETGVCMDCKSPQSICSVVVTTRLSKPAGRIKIVLIGEELGY